MYRYDCLSYTNIPKFKIYRNFSVYRNLQYDKIVNFALLQYKDSLFNNSKWAEFGWNSFQTALKFIANQFTVVNNISHFLKSIWKKIHHVDGFFFLIGMKVKNSVYR